MVSLSGRKSFETEIACPWVLSRANVYIGNGCLVLVIFPAVSSRGMGERMWAPSMPPFSPPSSRLSRVTAQEVCFITFTSGMPCLAKKPFSLAMIRGEASVRAIKPRVAPLTSVSPPPAPVAAVSFLDAVAGGLPPQAATTRLPTAVLAAVSRKRRRENEAMELGRGNGTVRRDSIQEHVARWLSATGLWT